MQFVFNINGFNTNFGLLNSFYNDQLMPNSSFANLFCQNAVFQNQFACTNIFNNFPQQSYKNFAIPAIQGNNYQKNNDNKNLGKDFYEKLEQISKNIGCNSKDLLAVMKCESGLNPQAKNKKSNAVGLIQFMPKTAKSLGTTVQDLEKMSAVQQLDYVERYLKNAKNISGLGNKTLTAGELYALIFMPSKANHEVLTMAGKASYSANIGLDLNKDGQITKNELGMKVQSMLA